MFNREPFDFLNINKPAGLTSHDVVDRLRRVTGIRAIGHTGTLDPLATGVLVLCIGKTTRLASFVESQEKEYVATVRLGVLSDTYDVTGKMSDYPGGHDRILEQGEIESAIQRFTGTIQQTPPPFSAIKINGERAYKLARQGQTPVMTPRSVTIQAIEILKYGWPMLELRIACSKGTYIRSLAHDIGAALGTGGLMEQLERTRVGALSVQDAIPLDMITPENWKDYLLAPEKVLSNYPKIILNARHLEDIFHGREISSMQKNLSDQQYCLLFSEAGEFVALAAYDGEKQLVRPIRVFAEKSK